VRRVSSLVRLVWAFLVVVIVSSPVSAAATVVRHAVIIGNNTGERDETELRYAERDAEKMRQVLEELGDFPPENVVLLQGKDANTVQRVLIAVNDRIRSERSAKDQSVLLVYYSGHGDADALHLGSDRLELSRLRRLVRGSSADFRLLILDACRSGALTRVKGGQKTRPFEIEVDDALAGEGVAFLTASSANEDAQESDELEGSFFTHYLVSGMRGAADRDGDGAVSVEEAYAYAYDHSLRESSRTLHGMQHATFEFDLRGSGKITLTRVAQLRRNGAKLAFPSERSWLVFAGGPQGPVVAEIGVYDRRRTLNVSAGRYFVRGRARDHLLEGVVTARAGTSRTVRDQDLRRIEYARLARKGGTERVASHGPQVGYQLRTPLWRDAALCHGVRAGYAADLRWFSIASRVGFCRSGFANDRLRATADEYDLDVAITRVFDVPVVSIGVGLGLGAAWLRQSFETRGHAPARDTAAGHFDLVLDLGWDLPRGFQIITTIAGQVYVFARQRGDDDVVETAARFTARALVGVGKRF
jgi:hypothetical protein